MAEERARPTMRAIPAYRPIRPAFHGSEWRKILAQDPCLYHVASFLVCTFVRGDSHDRRAIEQRRPLVQDRAPRLLLLPLLLLSVE
jgi:hypothetical protein